MPGHKHGDANPALSIGIKNDELVVCCRSGNHNQEDLFKTIVSKPSGNGDAQESSPPTTEKKPKPSESSDCRGIECLD